MIVTDPMPAVASDERPRRLRRSGALAPNDFAWLASAPALTGDTLLTVADGPSPVLHLHNLGTRPRR